MTHAIEPKLFGIVDIYAKELAKVTPGTPVKDDHILFFCENLFVQFFQNAVKPEITGFDDKSKATAVRRLMELEGKADPTVLAMIAKFIGVADDWEKIKGATYGYSGEFWYDFHCTVLPDVLAATGRYAASATDTDLGSAVSAVTKTYSAVIASICP